jgi:hypothetical protein
LTQGSTSGTDYVGKLMGSMDTQWKGVFEPTGNLAAYNGNQYVLSNGDSIPTIPTKGMAGGKRRKNPKGNITVRRHQQDLSGITPPTNVTIRLPPPINPNVTVRKPKRGKRGGYWGSVINQALVPFGLWGAQYQYAKRTRRTH